MPRSPYLTTYSRMGSLTTPSFAPICKKKKSSGTQEKYRLKKSPRVIGNCFWAAPRTFVRTIEYPLFLMRFLIACLIENIVYGHRGRSKMLDKKAAGFCRRPFAFILQEPVASSEEFEQAD